MRRNGMSVLGRKTGMTFAARHTLVMGLAHAGDQLFAQLADRLGIDTVVDGLV